MTPVPAASADPAAQPGGVANDPAVVAAFVDLFTAFPVAELIGNLHTQVTRLDAGGRCFPLTLNEQGSRTCYICCPSAAYIDYAIDETRNFLSRPLLRRAIRALIGACAPLVRASGLDHQAQVNNWLFSTNPAPLLTRAVAAEIRQTLIRRYPDRAIVMRGLNEMADAQTLAALRAEGFRLLPARQVYIAAALDKTAMTKNMREDRRLMRRSPWQVVEDADFGGADYARSEALYNMLYLDKYTPLNPHYTARYIREMHQRGIMRMMGLRGPGGQLAGVSGLFRNGATLTQPIVGYDTALPRGAGLYRAVMALAQDHAAAHGLFFNMSAGAADFKRRRGAVPVIEYTAVYVRHLPPRQRIATGIMETVLARIGVPLLRRFGL
jgi:hypothetical protein